MTFSNDQEYPTTNYLRGMLAMRVGDFASAFTILEDEPEGSPCFVLARGNAALCLFNLNRLADAKAGFLLTLKRIESDGCPHAPAEIQFRRNHADVVCNRGRRAEALDLFQHVCERSDLLCAEKEEWRHDILIQKAHTFVSIGVTWAGVDDFRQAIDYFHRARVLYEQLGDPSREGEAAVLSNMAYTYRGLGRHLEAYYALQEARTIATTTNDQEQLTRAMAALSQLFENDVSQLVTAAVEAEARSSFEAAFIRYCLAAESFLNQRRIEEARKCIERAKRLISSLDRSSLLAPRLRGLDATLAAWENAPREEVAELLTVAANEWFERLASRNLTAPDFDLISVDLHEDFRRLTISLLDVGEAKRALLAFEAGRALSTGRDFDPTFIERVIASQPFSTSYRDIPTDLIDEQQSHLCHGEVALVIVELPPNLMAFIVGKDSIRVAVSEIGYEEHDLRKWFDKCHSLPHQLRKGTGESAVPAQILDLAEKTLAVVCDAAIVRLIPYKLTHLIPWRVIFRNAGFEWRQLRFAIEFGLLFPHVALGSRMLRESGVIALGHGDASGVDFKQEAVEFVQMWGDGAVLQDTCTFTAVREALKSSNSVLISCHGVSSCGTIAFKLATADSTGNAIVSAAECLPRRMNVPLLILSACLSGVYMLDDGDNPVGLAPLALRRGTNRVICTRWEINALFAKSLVVKLAGKLHDQSTLENAFVSTLSELENEGNDLWQHLGCIELLGQG